MPGCISLPGSRGVSGGSRGSLPNDSLLKSSSRARTRRVDAVISNFQSVLESTQKALSGVPVPGSDVALEAFGTLLDRVSAMRANAREKEELISRIEDLLVLLGDHLQQIALAVQSTAQNKKSRTQTEVGREIREPNILRQRITALVSKIQEISKSAPLIEQQSWWSKLWFAEQDADALSKIREMIDEAIGDFKMQGSIDIRQFLEIILNETLRQERIQRKRAERATLEKLNASNASHRSVLTEGKSRLEPGTRAKILKDLMDWTSRQDPSERILVLHGRAGMGKSSIVHALLRSFPEDRIAASFFFNRGSEECKDPYRVVPTLAHQLANVDEESLRTVIVEAVHDHLARGRSQTLQHQLQELVIDPLTQVYTSPAPILLALDGVDECLNDPDDIVPQMLRHLCQAALELPFLRILIATRPETYIMDALQSPQYCDFTILRDLQDEADIDQDIRLFIEAEFKRCTEKGKFMLIEQRPDAVAQLTRLCDGLFVYASIVIRYLVHNKHYAVTTYDRLLESQGSMGSARMYEKLDMLYATILENAFRDYSDDQDQMDSIRQVLIWISLGMFGDGISAEDLQLVGIQEHVTMDVVERLTSVLLVEDAIAPTTKVKAVHASFPQFLMDHDRCKGSLFIDPELGQATITRSLLELLSRDDLTFKVIPRMWHYARDRWVDHLVRVQHADLLGDSLHVFAERHLDNWISKTDLWFNQYTRLQAVDIVAQARDWYKFHGSDPELQKLFDVTIDRRVGDLVDSMSRLPTGLRFDASDTQRLKSWRISGYTPPEETGQPNECRAENSSQTGSAESVDDYLQDVSKQC